MKIAIDGSVAMTGGSATYMHNILSNLAAIDKENEYIIICTQDQVDWNIELQKNFHYMRVPLCGTDTRKRIQWMQIGLPRLLREHNVHVLYSPNDLTSLFAPCPVVLAIRNVSPYADSCIIEEELQGKLRFIALRRLTKFSAWKADSVIFVSNHSKKIISKRLGIPSKKSVVIYHGLNEKFNSSGEVRPKFSRYMPYILSVSTIYLSKNYIPLIQAFARLLREYGLLYNLLIVGKTVHDGYRKQMERVIADEGICPYVHLLGEIEYLQMPELYAGARLFAFPSYLETFGHPLVEAMGSGVPVASSNASVMPEICGDAALYFNPFDPDEMAQVMYRVLTDDVSWKNMRRRGLERSREFSWEKTARRTLDVLRSVIH